jgi:hypothetical protein
MSASVDELGAADEVNVWKPLTVPAVHPLVGERPLRSPGHWAVVSEQVSLEQRVFGWRTESEATPPERRALPGVPPRGIAIDAAEATGWERSNSTFELHIPRIVGPTERIELQGAGRWELVETTRPDEIEIRISANVGNDERIRLEGRWDIFEPVDTRVPGIHARVRVAGGVIESSPVDDELARELIDIASRTTHVKDAVGFDATTTVMSETFRMDVGAPGVLRAGPPGGLLEYLEQSGVVPDPHPRVDVRSASASDQARSVDTAPSGALRRLSELRPSLLLFYAAGFLVSVSAGAWFGGQLAVHGTGSVVGVPGAVVGCIGALGLTLELALGLFADLRGSSS